MASVRKFFRLAVIVSLFSGFSVANAQVPPSLPVSVSPNGDIPAFSVPCTGTNVTLLLVNSVNFYPFSIGSYMRRPCTIGVAHFDSSNLTQFLNTYIATYPGWVQYIPLQLVVKDTTTLFAVDAPVYQVITSLPNSSNGYNYAVQTPQDNTYPTIGVSATFTFDGSTWAPVATTAPTCCSNVLFIPGLEASRLYQTSPVGSGENQLWEPRANADVEKLYLNADGTSINTIYTRDIIKETNVPTPTGSFGQNIYKSFTEMMDILVSDNKINRWEAYPYDWREDVQSIVDNGTSHFDGKLSLTAVLDTLVASSKNGKVTIVSHSNGGLIAKTLLKKLQDDKVAGRNNLIDNVDVLILVAVPQIGTATAVPAILHGYDQKAGLGWIMDEIHARELGRNMPGAYGLLPSKAYIDHVSISPVTIIGNASIPGPTKDLVTSFGSAINSYIEYKDFLFGSEGRSNPLLSQINLPIKISGSLFTKAETLHDVIDAWTPPSGLRLIEIAGWGLDTVASYEYYPMYSCTSNSGPQQCVTILDEKPKFTSDGDKTVVTPSAQYMSLLGGNEQYWVDFSKYNTIFKINRKHKDILEINQLNNFISSLIKKENPTYDLVLNNVQPIDRSNRLRLSIHSPVTLDAYDVSGNHTGKVCSQTSNFCYVEENILNSSYLEFGEGKYLNLPEDQMSKVKLLGTDIGTFTYESEKVLPNGMSTTSSFIDIPVTPQTQAEITLNLSGIPQLKLDVTGDGVIDFTLSPSTAFDPVTYLQIMKATIDSLDLAQAKKNAFDNRVDNIIKLIQKGKIDKAKLKADKFITVLQNKLSKTDPKHPKPKKLSRTDAQFLLDMLNQLLDNMLI